MISTPARQPLFPGSGSLCSPGCPNGLGLTASSYYQCQGVLLIGSLGPAPPLQMVLSSGPLQPSAGEVC